jgi:hypothetical protein
MVVSLVGAVHHTPRPKETTTLLVLLVSLSDAYTNGGHPMAERLR